MTPHSEDEYVQASELHPGDVILVADMRWTVAHSKSMGENDDWFLGYMRNLTDGGGSCSQQRVSRSMLFTRVRKASVLSLANTRWEGADPEAVIACLEKKLADARRQHNEFYVRVLAATQIEGNETMEILAKALRDFQPSRGKRPKRRRRHARRLLEQAADVLRERP